MNQSLNDLAQELIDNKSITNSYGDKYTIKSMTEITDPSTGNTGWKAVLTSRGYLYSSCDLASDQLNAVIKSLQSLQAMGRFSNYRLDNEKPVEKQKKVKSPPMVKTPVVKTPVVEKPEEPESIGIDDSQEIPEPSNQTPEQIEKSVILRIVTRTHQK